jgi:hypothetical protein
VLPDDNEAIDDDDDGARVPECRGGQVARRTGDLHDGQVRGRVGADDRRLVHAPVAEGHLKAVALRVRHDMVVRQDMPRRVEDDA